MSSNLSKNILATIAYYDVMDYPMTAFEIWKYLITQTAEQKIADEEKKEFSLAEVIKELENGKITRFVEKYRGFYFLKGRKDLVPQRLQRNKISEKKFKAIRKIVYALKFIPFVRMVAVAGRVAMKNAESKSDVDLCIIFKHGRIFTGRFLATALIQIFGKRRYGEKIADRVCLNHFLSDKCEVSIKDLYSSHVYSFLVPVYNAEAFKEFQEKNGWIKNYRSNFEAGINNRKEIKDSRFSKLTRVFLEKILFPGWIERKMEEWQVKRIQNNPKTQNPGGIIIHSETELAFWPDFEKQGPRIFESFYEKILKLK